MRKATKDLLLRALDSYRGDDLERAEMAFRGRSPERMQLAGELPEGLYRVIQVTVNAARPEKAKRATGRRGKS